MAPIPLTMIGIVPGHWLLGADFTATSMIGFIAVAGIIVRNSILLVEYARERVAEGMVVQDAIILAGRVRLRPILITALALVIGSMVLLSDPIFQGMAVSLLFGSLVATFLTLVVIPMGCVLGAQVFHRPPTPWRLARPDRGRSRRRPHAPFRRRTRRRARSVGAGADRRPSPAPRAQERRRHGRR